MSGPPETADTSVVVPALLDWHEWHDQASRAVQEISALPGHVVCETVSVLSRLPHGLAVAPSVAVPVLREAFPEPPLLPGEDVQARLLDALARYEIRGKAVYDALIGLTAGAAGYCLATLDRRASRTYQQVGVSASYLD
ncbi:MAG: PIN domain-containing protein [Actinobacteria bacterium]|nr:PIN domain-containing protein [Actinomycetota bacterium]